MPFPSATIPPNDVNVIAEVPIGGEPIKYEMDKAAGTLFVDRFLHTPMRYPGTLRLCAAHAFRRWRPD
jgi:inorganic pyrophosphatase